MAELIKMQFGETYMSRGNVELIGICMGATWRVQLNDLCVAVIQAVTTLP